MSKEKNDMKSLYLRSDEPEPEPVELEDITLTSIPLDIELLNYVLKGWGTNVEGYLKGYNQENKENYDFSGVIEEYKKLEDSQKTDKEEITGTITYIDISGGFFGVITDSDEKYLPINIQKDLKENKGKRITITNSFEKKDTVSIFMWGILIYVGDDIDTGFSIIN